MQRVKDASPIEQIVGERVRLAKRGALFEACCPFHDEKTPSFKVDARRQTWRCFGACSEGGDVIKFVERFDGTSFFEALEELARGAGIEIPRQRRDRREKEDANRPLYDALAEAQALFRDGLSTEDGRAAREYLAQRSLSEEVQARFGIGWAPARGNSVTRAARRADVPAAWLGAGLVRRNDAGEGYDFFRGRLMIPIADRSGRVVGFGGRILPGDPSPAKYVNTPETPVFHKGRLIYGWHLATDAIRRERRVVLMEGYTDVMAAHQVGLMAAVAVLGTSTTDDHARLIKRSGARRAYLVFDGDDAGRKAARRAIGGLVATDVELFVAAPPEGQDPADVLLAEGGRERFEQSLEAAEPWFDWMVGVSKRAFGSPDSDHYDAAGLAEAVDELLEMIDAMQSPVEQDALLLRAASSLGLSIDSLRRRFQTLASRRANQERRAKERAERTSPRPTTNPLDPNLLGLESTEAEPDTSEWAQAVPRSRANVREAADRARVREAFADLLGALLADNGLIPVYRDLRASCPEGPLERVFQVLLETYDRDDVDPIDASYLLTALCDDPARDVVDRLALAAETAESPALLAEEQAAWLARRNEELELFALRRDLSTDPTDSQAVELVPESAASDSGLDAKTEALLRELHERLRANKVPGADPDVSNAS